MFPLVLGVVAGAVLSRMILGAVEPPTAAIVAGKAPGKYYWFYTTQPGDTLERLAIAFYDDPSKANVIATYNANIFDRAGNLKIGITLKILPQWYVK